MKTTIYDDNGNATRVTLPAPFYGTAGAGPSGSEDATGTWYVALYWGPRSGRCFVESYSIWDRGDGQTVGTVVSECSPSEMLHYCDRVGVAAPEGILDSVPQTVID